MAQKREILGLVEGRVSYPLTKEELVTALEDAAAAPDLLLAAQAIDDDRFVDAAELEHRLDEALGVPDVDPGHSALQGGTGWTAET